MQRPFCEFSKKNLFVSSALLFETISGPTCRSSAATREDDIRSDLPQQCSHTSTMSKVPSHAVVPTDGDNFDSDSATFDVENPIRKSTGKGSKLARQSSAATELLGHEKDLRWWTELGKCNSAPRRSFKGMVVVCRVPLRHGFVWQNRKWAGVCVLLTQLNITESTGGEGF